MFDVVYGDVCVRVLFAVACPHASLTHTYAHTHTHTHVHTAGPGYKKDDTSPTPTSPSPFVWVIIPCSGVRLCVFYLIWMRCIQ